MANDRDGQPISPGTDYVPIGPALTEAGDKTLLSMGGQPTLVDTAKIRRVSGFASASDITSIGLQLDVINTAIDNKQALDALLTAISALTTVADRVIYCTGADTVALTTFTAAARTFAAAVDAAAQRAAIGAAPTVHAHSIGDVTDLESELDAINFALAGKASTAHNHAGSDITSGTVSAARLPSATTSAQGIVELATSGENTANVVVQGNDARLSDARTPTAHTHSASDINAGTLGAARLPALTGAVTSSAGSAATAFGSFKANAILMNMTNASGVPTAVDGVDAAANMWAFLGGSYLLPAWDLANAKLGSIAI